MKSWRGPSGGEYHVAREDEDVELLLSPQQLSANTTFGLTPGPSLGFSTVGIIPKVTLVQRTNEIQAAKNRQHLNLERWLSFYRAELRELLLEDGSYHVK